MQTFTQTKVVLMYRNKPTENYYTDDYMFVMQDDWTGGYPTRTTMDRAHNFKTTEAAASYDKKGEFVIAELTITGTVVVDEKIDSVRLLKVAPKEK